MFRIRGDEYGTREFIRGPALTMAILFRSDQDFVTIRENFSTVTAMSIFTQVSFASSKAHNCPFASALDFFTCDLHCFQVFHHTATCSS